jgi:small subunit ribosomal protein S20
LKIQVVIDWSCPLANTKQAKKRVRQAKKHRAHNASERSKLRTYIKKVNAAIAARDPKAALAAMQAAVPIIDSMINKKIIHRNKAARHKSRLTKSIRKIAE